MESVYGYSAKKANEEPPRKSRRLNNKNVYCNQYDTNLMATVVMVKLCYFFKLSFVFIYFFLLCLSFFYIVFFVIIYFCIIIFKFLFNFILFFYL